VLLRSVCVCLIDLTWCLLLLYVVADRDNHRVVFFPYGSTVATKVYGQVDLTTVSSSCSQTGMISPSGVAVDASNNLFGTLKTEFLVCAMLFSSLTGIMILSCFVLLVADLDAHRVLVFASGSTIPFKVYGQNGNFSSCSPATSATGLYSPNSLAVDSTGGLYGQLSVVQSSVLLHVPCATDSHLFFLGCILVQSLIETIIAWFSSPLET
jgi:hypothetical protein